MIEIPITSAFQFFETAHKLKKNRDHSSEIEFYRGHSNKEWRLMPSIYRQFMLSFEENLINEFIRRRPDEFPESSGLFNIIAKMQHYGLHTRLLDVTESPAVSLFFACYENFDSDGEVFLFQESLDDIPNNTVLNILAEFYIRYTKTGGLYDVKAYYEMIKQNHAQKDVEMAFYHIMNGYSCFSRPKVISERILRQAGSFMLFTNEVCPKENCRQEKCRNRDEGNCKNDIISKDLNERINNLTIRRTLRDFTEAHIKNRQDGYRYIVKSDSKKEILSELQTIGINKAFLFPELNIEGADIMEDYYSRVT